MCLLMTVPGINPHFFNLTFFFQSLVNGVTNGATYAAMALTVVVIFRTTGHLNLAQGEMATFTTFIVATLAVSWGWPIWGVIPMVVIGAMVVGAGIERGLIRSLDRKKPVAVLIVGLGLYLIFNSLSAALWGTDQVTPAKPLPGKIADRFLIMRGTPNVFVTYAALLTWLSLALIVALLWLLMHRTKLGLAYRAVASNRESSYLVGVPVGRMLMLGWALAAGIGAITGLIVAQLTNSLDFNLMGNVLIYGFAAACLGGFDSIIGAVVGGIVVGLVESVGPNLFTFVGAELGLTMALVVIVAVLVLRPQGLFGVKRMERV